MIYYNDNDAFLVLFLKNLVRFGLIPGPAKISGKSIADIKIIPNSVRQAHVFAGIGGWAKALQLAQQKMLSDERFNNPAYWAPFILIGNWL